MYTGLFDYSNKRRKGGWKEGREGKNNGFLDNKHEVWIVVFGLSIYACQIPTTGLNLCWEPTSSSLKFLTKILKALSMQQRKANHTYRVPRDTGQKWALAPSGPRWNCFLVAFLMRLYIKDNYFFHYYS